MAKITHGFQCAAVLLEDEDEQREFEMLLKVAAGEAESEDEVALGESLAQKMLEEY